MKLVLKTFKNRTNGTTVVCIYKISLKDRVLKTEKASLTLISLQMDLCTYSLEVVCGVPSCDFFSCKIL